MDHIHPWSVPCAARFPNDPAALLLAGSVSLAGCIVPRLAHRVRVVGAGACRTRPRLDAGLLDAAARVGRADAGVIAETAAPVAWPWLPFELRIGQGFATLAVTRRTYRDALVNALAAIGLALCSALFFTLTYVLNRSLVAGGGHWAWAVILRYLFTLPLLAAGAAAAGRAWRIAARAAPASARMAARGARGLSCCSAFR